MNLAEDVEDVLIPDALEYYLGLNDDLFDGDEEDDDEDGDHDEEGDSGEDADNIKKGKKKGKGGDKIAGDAQQQKECKQQ